MAYRPNEETGTKPELDVIAYETVDQQGNRDIIRVQCWSEDKVGNLREAWVIHPRYGSELMNPREGRIANANPIRIVLRDKYDTDMDALLARITGLESQVLALTEFIESVKVKAATKAAAVGGNAAKA